MIKPRVESSSNSKQLTTMHETKIKAKPSLNTDIIVFSTNGLYWEAKHHYIYHEINTHKNT